MRKILQTVTDKDHGSCMQAAVASLLNLELKAVPNFIEHGDMATSVLLDFIESYGYTCTYYDRIDDSYPTIEEVAKADKGIFGHLYAVVPSQTYENVTHAVVVDLDLNIVHDPNPNQKALDLKPEDVTQILCVNNNWFIDQNKNLIVK